MKKHIYIISNSLSPKFLQFNTQLGPQWLVPGLQRTKRRYEAKRHTETTNDTRWWGDAPCKACKVWENQQFLTSQRKQISDDWIPHGLLCETLAEKCLKFWRDFWNPLFHPDGLATALSKNLSFTLLYVSSANEAKQTIHKSTYQESDRRERVERTLADLSLFSWKRIWLRSCGSLHLQSPCERMHADFLPLVKLLEHPLFILFKLEPRGTKS